MSIIPSDESPKVILLTGGLGFIGSHMAVELIEQGYDVVIVDNLSNSSISVLDKIHTITGAEPTLYQIDIRNQEDLNTIFEHENIDCVIHFAAFKAVGESVNNPINYYDNNIVGLITLLKVMDKHNVNKIIFSSSATVYGNPTSLPLTESSSLNILNPYGMTKLIGEQILQDLSNVKPDWEIVILRYFNPVGAHKSGEIGELPSGVPNNLFPYILDVVRGIREHLNIYGSDYNTHDGTGVRDYIHVVDLVKGHTQAFRNMKPGVKIYNLGTGIGYSVLDIVNTFNKVLTKSDIDNNNNEVKYRLVDRRDGDSPEVYADSSKAYSELGWKAMLDLDDMVRDSLNFMNNSLKETI